MLFEKKHSSEILKNEIMKKLLIAALVIFLGANLAKSQVADHGIGLRLGGGDGLGTEISYQHGLSSLNRLEFDLGFNNHDHYDAWALTTTYQWVWSLDQGFNWFVGGGGRIGSWSHDNYYDGSNDDGLFLAAAGDVGIEYVFPIGIQLAIDARPKIGLINHGSGIDLGFAIRYQF